MSFFKPVRRYEIRGEFLLEPADSLAASAIEFAAVDDSVVQVLIGASVITIVGTDDFKDVSAKIAAALAPDIAANNALHG